MKQFPFDICIVYPSVFVDRILSNLSVQQYNEVLKVVEESILATDLALHFSHLEVLQGLGAKGPSGNLSLFEFIRTHIPLVYIFHSLLWNE